MQQHSEEVSPVSVIYQRAMMEGGVPNDASEDGY